MKLSSLLATAVLLSWAAPTPAQEQAPKTIIIAAHRHDGDNAQSVAFSPDGKYVAAGFGGPANGRFPLKPRGGGIAVWEVETGRQLHYWEEYGDIIKLEFSRDGESLAYGRVFTPGDSVEDNVVVVRNVKNGKVSKRWSENRNRYQFAMSRSAQEILVGRDVYELKDFTRVNEVGDLEPRCLAFAMDGRSLAMVHSVKVPIVDKDGVERKQVHSLVMKSLAVFDAVRLEKQRSIETSDVASCYALALAPDGKYLATGHNAGVARIWDTANLAEIRKIETGFRGHVLPFFAPDGKALAVATQPTRSPRWKYDETEPSGFKIDHNKPDATSEVLFLETTGWNETARWQFEDGSFRTYYYRHGKGDLHPEYNPGRFVFSPDGKHLLAGCSGVVLVEASTGKFVQKFEVQRDRP